MTFLSLERITGRYIAEKVMEFLKGNDLPVENIHGQGYDGVSNMSTKRRGVQANYKKCLHLQHISTAVPTSYKSFMCLNRSS